jgi:hypothetical protein
MKAPFWSIRPSRPPVAAGAAERCDAAVEALELKMLYDASSFINVRLAADRCCSTYMNG